MQKKNKIIFIICALLVSLGTSSCRNDSSTLVYEFHAVSLYGWNKTDTVEFSLPEVATNDEYQTIVGVRTNARFPYANLWLGVSQVLQYPDTVFLDTVCCEVMAESDIMKEGIGLFLTECALPKRHYQAGQKGVIKVFHIHKKEEVPGVAQIGLQVQAVPKP